MNDFAEQTITEFFWKPFVPMPRADRIVKESQVKNWAQIKQIFTKQLAIDI